ncbi:MAG TPA: four-carbon acid sugar kinase family protein [bacterium]|nr:four-carbon acid sugar kinase family protein [bacterium]
MTLEQKLAALPPPLRIPGARRVLRDRLRESGAKLVVIDDDPTGTQTVHDVPVLMDWSAPALGRAFERPEPLFFVSTNSRSMPRAEAEALARQVGRALREAAAAAGGTRLLVASRSDSTLRGHFPAEVDALAAELPDPPDAVILVPAFFDAGRYTLDNIHWVDMGGALVPAAQTEFAKDPDFGYAHSDLREWVEEKTAGRIRANAVACISLETIRGDGPPGVRAILSQASGGLPVVANAASDDDLEVLALGVQAAEESGKRFIYRTSASFVKVRAGISDRPLLTRADTKPGPGPGLIVVGSYVEKTSRQVDALARSGSVLAVELSVQRLLDERAAVQEIQRVSSVVSRGLADGSTVLLFTSRKMQSSADFLAAGRTIMDGLCQVVRGIQEPPGFLVAKGGITSIALARSALGCQEAVVLGQILKGVPVWRLSAGSRWKDIPYVVFPGNVGNETALRDVVGALGLPDRA